MQYKTLILELLEQQPQLHQQLRRNHHLLKATDAYAQELKTRHEAWKERLSRGWPSSDQSQIPAAALEMALTEMEVRLSAESPRNEHPPLSLDGAMAFIRRHMPSA